MHELIDRLQGNLLAKKILYKRNKCLRCLIPSYVLGILREGKNHKRKRVES